MIRLELTASLLLLISGLAHAQVGTPPETGQAVTIPGLPEGRLIGQVTGESFGRSLASAGDVNDDGFANVRVGAYRNVAGGNAQDCAVTSEVSQLTRNAFAALNATAGVGQSFVAPCTGVLHAIEVHVQSVDDGPLTGTLRIMSANGSGPTIATAPYSLAETGFQRIPVPSLVTVDVDQPYTLFLDPPTSGTGNISGFNGDPYPGGNAFVGPNESTLTAFGVDLAFKVDLGPPCSGNLTLSSQAEVNAFACIEFTGFLKIEGADITTLAPLASLTAVESLLITSSPALTSLDGLDALTTVGDLLEVSSSPMVASLAGLNAVTSVGGDLTVMGTAATSLAGLNAITSVGGGIQIVENDSLTSLEGLNAVRDIGELLFIQGNPALTTLDGLTSLTTLEGGLNVSLNDALTSLKGLAGITSVNGELRVQSNDALASLAGLDGIASVTGELRIESNTALTTCSCGLRGLISNGAFSSVAGVTIGGNAVGGTCGSPAQVLSTPCVDCADGALLAFDTSAFDTDGNDPSFGELATLLNVGTAILDLTSCSVAAVDPLTKQVVFTSPLEGTVVTGEAYSLTTMSGSQTIPAGSIPDGPGAIMLVDGTTQVGEEVSNAVSGGLIAGVVYRTETDIFYTQSDSDPATSTEGFLAAVVALVSPTLTSPVDGASGIPFVETVFEYETTTEGMIELEISLVSDFSEIAAFTVKSVDESIVVRPGSYRALYAATVTGLLPNRTYFWRAVNTTTGTPPSPSRAFTTEQDAPPEFTSSPTDSAVENQEYSYAVAATDPNGAVVTITGETLPGWLALTDNGDGTAVLSGTPVHADVGSNDVTLTADDGTSTTGQVFSIVVVDVNTAPVAIPDSVTTFEEASINVAVLANDIDPDGDVLTLVSAEQPTNGAVSSDGGTVTYTPDVNFVGEDTFTYLMTDGSIQAVGPVVVTVRGRNDAPVAVNDDATTDEDTAVSVAVTSNDSDPDDATTLVISAVSAPASGSAVVAADGTTVVYTPSEDFFGTDAFTYTIDDGDGPVGTPNSRMATATATVRVTVRPINDAPSAPAITAPANGFVLNLVGAPTDEVSIEWATSVDVDGDELDYRWELSASESFASMLITQETEATQYVVTYGNLAAVLEAAGTAVGSTATLFHRTVATDGSAESVGEAARLVINRGTLVGAESGPGEMVVGRARPNPTRGPVALTLNLPGPGDVTYEVFDSTGREVDSGHQGAVAAGGQSIRIDLSDLGAGVYVYRLSVTVDATTEIVSGRVTVAK